MVEFYLNFNFSYPLFDNVYFFDRHKSNDFIQEMCKWSRQLLLHMWWIYTKNQLKTNIWFLQECILCLFPSRVWWPEQKMGSTYCLQDVLGKYETLVFWLTEVVETCYSDHFSDCHVCSVSIAGLNQEKFFRKIDIQNTMDLIVISLMHTLDTILVLCKKVFLKNLVKASSVTWFVT